MHIGYMDIGGYKYNFKSFCEKFTYPMFINRGRTIITQGDVA